MSYELESAGPHSDIGLGEIIHAFRRRLWVILLVIAACLGLAALATHMMTQRWRAVAQMVLVERATNGGASKESYAPPIVETVDTQMAMLQSDAMPQRTLAWLRANVGPRDPRLDVARLTTQSLQRAVSVATPKDTDVLQVSAVAPSPAQAALLADATCQAFLLWKRDVARKQIAAIVSDLQSRSTRAGAAMRDAERRATSFKESHHLTDPAAQEKSLLDQFQAQKAETDGLQKEAASLQAQLTGLQSQIHIQNAHIQTTHAVRDDTLVTSLQTQLDQLKAERAEAMQKYTAKYPGVLSDLDAKIHDTRSRLDAALDGILNGRSTSLQAQSALLAEAQKTRDSQTYTAAKLTAARRQQDTLRAQVDALPALDATYTKLTRDVQVTNALYLSLQPDLASAQADLARATGAVQITQQAVVPTQPFRPNKAQNLALGGLAGVFLAGLLVFLLESGDRRVRDRADVIRLAPGTILGSLPPVALSQGDLPPLVEQTYRRAYASLLLALHQSGQSTDLQRSVILVTSAVPGEGKSLTATQLARAIAASGKRTILVDANLSAPSPVRDVPAPKHGGHELRAEPYGLTDLLHETVLPAEALAATDQYHLLRLGQGRARHDAEALASMPKMEKALNALRDCADVIVIDAPACADRADALFLAPLADCIIQVIGAGRVDAGALQQTHESLAAARPRLLATFLNFSPERNVSRLPGPDRDQGTAPPEPAWQEIPAAEAPDLLDENRTTEIFVSHVPGQAPVIRLARPNGGPPPHTKTQGDGSGPRPHGETRQR